MEYLGASTTSHKIGYIRSSAHALTFIIKIVKLLFTDMVSKLKLDSPLCILQYCFKTRTHLVCLEHNSLKNIFSWKWNIFLLFLSRDNVSSSHKKCSSFEKLCSNSSKNIVVNYSEFKIHKTFPNVIHIVVIVFVGFLYHLSSSLYIINYYNNYYLILAHFYW